MVAVWFKLTFKLTIMKSLLVTKIERKKEFKINQLAWFNQTVIWITSIGEFTFTGLVIYTNNISISTGYLIKGNCEDLIEFTEAVQLSND